MSGMGIRRVLVALGFLAIALTPGCATTWLYDQDVSRLAVVTAASVVANGDIHLLAHAGDDRQFHIIVPADGVNATFADPPDAPLPASVREIALEPPGLSD